MFWFYINIWRVRMTWRFWRATYAVQRNLTAGMSPRIAAYEAFQRVADGIVFAPETAVEKRIKAAQRVHS
jgi:hypothetical protein